MSTAMCGESDLLVRRHVLQAGQLGHRPLDDRRPVVQLLGVGRGQRVLVLGLGKPAANIDVLAGLHEVAHAGTWATLGRRRWMICWAEASRWLNGFSWMNMRAVFSDECRRSSRRSPPRPARPGPSG